MTNSFSFAWMLPDVTSASCRILQPRKTSGGSLADLDCSNRSKLRPGAHLEMPFH